MKQLALALLVVLALALPALALGQYEDFLSVDEIGASRLIGKNPAWDGRGVVIAVLDTGVDMGVQGLTKTSTGEVKVIDAVDFSGEGKVALAKAFFETVGGQKVLKNKKGWVKGAESLAHKPLDGAYYLGVLAESKFRNSSLKDLNGNGKTDDEFAVVVFAVTSEKEKGGKEWVAFIDTAGDKDLKGAKAMRSYRETLKPFSFPSLDPAKPQHAVNCALTIEEDGKSVSIHIPGHSHGTHVAGICAGFKLKGRKDFNGIAPGAKVISCKISDGSLGAISTTESMKKALEFVALYAKEHKTPVVVSMSFGIGSEVEGSADIDRHFDTFCLENPEIPVVLSAGNEGPGLSTVGCPAAAYCSLTVGASFTGRNAAALMGGATKSSDIFFFSARGGELAKPDFAAPGIASSTVPNYEKKDLMRGTSMAAPEASGAVALLLSALKAKHPKARYNSFMVKQALKSTAKPLPGYTALDQGCGIIQADRAFALLEKLVSVKGAGTLMGYTVTTPCPSLPAGSAPAAFYRTISFPASPRSVEFSIAPLFTADASSDEKKELYRTFRLASTAPFIAADREAAYINGETALKVKVTIDKNQLKEPGLYTARVNATADGSLAFELPVTVIVPGAAAVEEDLPTVRLAEATVQPGKVSRRYFAVPPGCGEMELRLEAPEGKHAVCTFTLVDPDGRDIDLLKPALSTTEGRRVYETRVGAKDLVPCGVYELITEASPTFTEPATVKGCVTFFGLRAKKAKITKHEAGGLPEGSVTVENLFAAPFTGRVRAQLLGYVRESKEKMKGDSLKTSFTLAPGIRSVRVELELSRGDYGRFTDITARLLDKKGNAVAQSSFTYRKLALEYAPSGESGELTLEVKGGLAEESDRTTKIRIRQYFYTESGGAVRFTQSGEESLAVYPGYPRELQFAFASAPPMIPEGTKLFGEARFVSSSGGKVWLTLPLELEVKTHDRK